MTGPWIDEARGLARREIFFSDEIFRAECVRIFERTWVFLAHESEIRSPGDFVTRRLGRTPVIVTRTGSGSIRGFVNSCRHRGALLVRVESGNAARFTCPYHGWAYDHEGRRLPWRFDRLNPDDDIGVWGLGCVPRIETYGGLIFGSWNPDVSALVDHLGDFRWYLDLLFARTPGGMEVLAPPQRSRVPVNWKVPALNFGTDNQHVYSTHIGPFLLEAAATSAHDRAAAIERSVQLGTGNGHGCTLFMYPPSAPDTGYASGLRPLYDATLASDQAALYHRLNIAVGTVFPNLSFDEFSGKGENVRTKSLVLRHWQPVSARETEILTWYLAERESDQAYRDGALKRGLRRFGIAGTFEQDDIEIWASINEAIDSPIASDQPLSFRTALPHMATPLGGFPGPGLAFQPFEAEITQFRFLLEWQRRMSAAGSEA